MLAMAATCSALTKRTVETKTETKTNVYSPCGKLTTVSTVTTVATSEDITPHENMISTDPIKFWLFYNISYYRAISPHVVVGGGIQLPTAMGDREITGFGVNLEARFYIGGKPLRGFFMNPIFSFNSLSYEMYNWDAPGNTKVKDTPASLGLMMGWNWYPWEEFATTISIGADYNFSATSEEGLLGLGSDKQGVVPAARFTIGYAW
jgi:hypothetical protein